MGVINPDMSYYPPVQSMTMSPTPRPTAGRELSKMWSMPATDPMQGIPWELSYPASRTGERPLPEDYRYLPNARSYRMLEPVRQDPEIALARGMRQWWPTVFPNLHTPVADMLADPSKSAILTSFVTGGIGSLIGVMVAPAPLLGVIAGGLTLGTLGALFGYLHRIQQNENILDSLTYHPDIVTLRDLLQREPIYRSTLRRSNPISLS